MTKSKIMAIVGGTALGGFILPLGFTMAHRAITCVCPTSAQLASFGNLTAMIFFVAAGISMWRRWGAGHQFVGHSLIDG